MTLRKKLVTLVSAAAFSFGLISLSLPHDAAAAKAKTIFTQPKDGMAETAPISWGKPGKKTGIWARKVPVRAQALTGTGTKVGGRAKVTFRGKTSPLPTVDAVNLVKGKDLLSPAPKNVRYVVKYGKKKKRAKIFRGAAQCDTCHPGAVKNHGAGDVCVSCHGAGIAPPISESVHSFHSTIAASCTDCHVDTSANDQHFISGFLTDCTDCHGGIVNGFAGVAPQAATASFLNPNCSACHTAPYAVPAAAEFSDAVGHGGILCINCHRPAHRLVKPVNLGDGVNNNCVKCHKTKRLGHNGGGPDCSICHTTALDPHLVTLP